MYSVGYGVRRSVHALFLQTCKILGMTRRRNNEVRQISWCALITLDLHYLGFQEVLLIWNIMRVRRWH